MVIALNIHLNQQSGIPVYKQIIEQVQQMIASGRLVADQELLPIRVLAERLVINPNTVVRAYKELEASQWIYKVRGAGSFVAKREAKRDTELEVQSSLHEPIDALLIKAKYLNLSTDAVVALIQKRAKHLTDSRSQRAINSDITEDLKHD
jgi:GntR family transcriptional regulator